MKQIGLPMICMLLLGVGCSRGDIPMLGLDDDGKLVEVYASEKQFQSKLTEAVLQIHASTVPAIQATHQDRSAMLRSVIVGLGFNFEGGLGPIAKAGASPKVRFAFSNSQKPIIP